MLYTRASELAIRAALFLARQPPGKLCPVREIAQATELSEAYLAKILRRLTGTGLVRGFRGPGRGMQLGRSPEEISLWMLVRAMEGPERPDCCALGLKVCSEENPCALHFKWIPLRDAVRSLLSETTLASLVRTVRERGEQEKRALVPVEAQGSRGRSGVGNAQKAS